MANCPLCGARIKEPEMEPALEAMHHGFANGLRGNPRSHNPYSRMEKRMYGAWDRGFKIAEEAKRA